jgi:hypothetical protein
MSDVGARPEKHFLFLSFTGFDPEPTWAAHFAVMHNTPPGTMW